MGLFRQIHEDWVAHGRDWTKPGFRAVAVHRFGNWRMRIRPKVFRIPFSLLYRMMYRRCRNGYGIELPYDVKLGARVVIEHQGCIVIHGCTTIGDDCIIRQGVTLGNKTLDRPLDAPALGKRVNVGAGAKILGALTIGDDAAIGANAVVLTDVPAGAVAVGIPGRILEPAARREVVVSSAVAAAAPRIGVVAIGRNEGERLRRCLDSCQALAELVVYVDSGSTDGSAPMARARGVEVVDLDMTVPFTAARARNEGFRRLMQRAPELEFVQFVDGDCEIVGGWMETAAEFLRADPKVAVVCGRRRERFPDRSVYNLICDIEWDTPVGQTDACGGDAMMRASAFRHVNGYNPAVIAGEEPEMCVRLRQLGWKIMRLGHEMTLHDAAMTRFGQWWKRAVRGGHAYAEARAMHGGAPVYHRRRETRSIWFWGLLLPIAALALAWPTRGASLIVLLAGYAVLAYRIGRRARRASMPPAHAKAWARYCTLAKVPQAVGQAKYWLGRVRRKPSAIIEYK